MKRMKTLFATIHLEPSTRAVPLAAACLKAVIKKHDVYLANYFLHQSPHEIAENILSFVPEIVGFPVYLWNRSSVLDIIRILKEKAPGIIVLAGGPEVTAEPERFLSDSLSDYVMEGEGEEIIQPLLDALELKENPIELPGLWSPNAAPSRSAYCWDFNGTVSPILSGALDLHENPGLLWELSRGCPFACDFCFESKGSRKVRSLAMDRIEKELLMIRDAGIQQVFVLDPTFNTDRERVLKILDLIKRHTPDTYFYFEVRSEFLDEETAAAFSEIPCTLQIGLQSSDPGVLKNVNRNLDPEAFRKKMEILSEYHVSFGLDLIYGLPADSLEGFRSSINYALSLEPNHLDLFPLAVLPGTVLHENAESLGLLYQTNDPYQVLRTNTFDTPAMKKAASLSDYTDELYNQAKGISWMHTVCRDLKKDYVSFIESWGSFRMRDGKSADTRLSDILEFLQEIYSDDDLYRARRDLLNYLEILDSLEELEKSAEEPESGVILNESSRVSLAYGAMIQRFALHPAAIPESVYMTGEDLAGLISPADSQWIFWSREWELCFEVLEPETAAVLNSLKTPQAIKDIQCDGMESEKLSSLIMEGILEGYLTLF